MWLIVISLIICFPVMTSAAQTVTPYIIESGFSELAHGVSSGRVTVKDTKTIEITDLVYDGAGPDAFFWAGGGTSPNSNGWIIPDENGSTQKLSRYESDTITITLPDQYTVNDMGYLSIWCRRFTQDFGNVIIPSDITVPPFTEQTGTTTVTTTATTAPAIRLSNCEQMHERFNVAWEFNGDYIKFEFTGALEDEGYMAFGLSGSDSTSIMAGSDVSVASFYSESESFRADDYFLSAYAQCSGGQGACPDDPSNKQGSNEDVEGSITDGVTTISFKRRSNTTDVKDLVYRATGGAVYVVWAMGIHSVDVIVTKHNLVLTDRDTQIDFGRTAAYNCPAVQGLGSEVETEPWLDRVVDGRSGETTFTARIGPTGPDAHGFHAITESQGWGIAWYINGQLIPEVMVKRGITYTFMVEGGNDESNGAKYHPLYITDDSEGGYVQMTDAQKAMVTIYAGVDDSGNPTTGAIGRYCEYKLSSTSLSQSVYSEYLDSLTLDCETGSPGTLTWTPDANTPDTVYYQCYTHRYLGFVITVVDEIEPDSDASTTTSSTTALFVPDNDASTTPSLSATVCPNSYLTAVTAALLLSYVLKFKF